MKYKNKEGISLNYIGDDVHTNLVKEVINAAIRMLQGPRHHPHRICNETIIFLKENFDIISVEDFIGEKVDV